MKSSVLECLIFALYALIFLIAIMIIVALIDPTRYYSGVISELIALMGGIVAALKLRRKEG